MNAEINKTKITSRKKPFSFVRKTGYFLIAGFFIYGFTAIVLIRLQMLLSKFGVECSMAWNIIFIASALCALITPYLFIRYFTKVDFNKVGMTKRLICFNLLEYTFIQAGLTPLFTNANTLCYVRDGQNGIELALTAWFGLPILILLSWLFDVLHKRNLQKQMDKC